MKDVVETLCSVCHRKEPYREKNFSKSIEEFAENQRLMSEREKAKEREKIEEKRKAEEKSRIEESERAEEIRKRIKPCFFCSKETILLKDGVPICQKCSKYGNVVHHIDYDKENNNPNNLISLCRNCHAQTNFKREYWTNYFKNENNNSIRRKTICKAVKR